jgi:hypothetical protein
LTLLMLIAPAPAQAAEVSQFRFQGPSGSAVFFGTDPSDPCINRTIFVGVTEGREKVGSGAPLSESNLFVSLFQFNSCTGQFLDAFGFATLADEAFQVDNQLRSATLTATVELCGFGAGICVPFDINLTWTGTGVLEREKTTTHLDTPNCKFRSHFMGSFRDAVAIGSVSGFGTNFTPDPSFAAELLDVKTGRITIGCGI